jgi:hypothetical protein
LASASNSSSSVAQSSQRPVSRPPYCVVSMEMEEESSRPLESLPPDGDDAENSAGEINETNNLFPAAESQQILESGILLHDISMQSAAEENESEDVVVSYEHVGPDINQDTDTLEEFTVEEREQSDQPLEHAESSDDSDHRSDGYNNEDSYESGNNDHSMEYADGLDPEYVEEDSYMEEYGHEVNTFDEEGQEEEYEHHVYKEPASYGSKVDTQHHSQYGVVSYDPRPSGYAVHEEYSSEWVIYTSAEGYKYYYNHRTGESQWVDYSEESNHVQQQHTNQRNPPTYQTNRYVIDPSIPQESSYNDSYNYEKRPKEYYSQYQTRGEYIDYVDENIEAVNYSDEDISSSEEFEFEFSNFLKSKEGQLALEVSNNNSFFS